MSNRQIEARDGATTEATTLAKEMLDKELFSLINNFRKSFRNARDFQEALVQTYIGKLDYGYKIAPENARRVEFWRGNTYWGIDYAFTRDKQILNIQRNTHLSKKEHTEEYINLESRRDSGDPEVIPGKILYQKFDVGSTTGNLIRETDTEAALEYARKILSDFDPSFSLESQNMLHSTNIPFSPLSKHVS